MRSAFRTIRPILNHIFKPVHTTAVWVYVSYTVDHLSLFWHKMHSVTISVKLHEFFSHSDTTTTRTPKLFNFVSKLHNTTLNKTAINIMKKFCTIYKQTMKHIQQWILNNREVSFLFCEEILRKYNEMLHVVSVCFMSDKVL